MISHLALVEQARLSEQRVRQNHASFHHQFQHLNNLPAFSNWSSPMCVDIPCLTDTPYQCF